MSDSDPTDIEEIRQQKRESLEQTADAATEPLHVESQEHFQSLTADHDVLLVDFFADWCGPCDMLEPIVERVAAETPATVAKVDIDELQALAQEFGVRSVPTLLLFADGDQVEQLVGVQEEATLRDLVGRYA